MGIRHILMAQGPQTADALKQAMKEALAESLSDQRDLLYEVFTEVLEDFAVTDAIRQGRESELDDREAVFGALRANNDC